MARKRRICRRQMTRRRWPLSQNWPQKGTEGTTRSGIYRVETCRRIVCFLCPVHWFSCHPVDGGFLRAQHSCLSCEQCPSRRMVLFHEPAIVRQREEEVMKTLLRCKVGPGLFSGEFAVRGTTSDKVEFSCFVPGEYVRLESPLQRSHPVDGWLCVEEIEARDPLVLVRLPHEAFENGSVITVERSQVAPIE